MMRADNPFDLTFLEAVALVDTGATVSGIDYSIAEKLELEPLGKRPLQSAHGLAHTERFMFRIGLMSDGSDETSLPFIFDASYGIGLTGSQHFTALIGMDILRQCDFSIDRYGRCRLVFG
ncbi:aspartyl protease family protein [Sphingobium terrigena]|nr:aspartyl protease family protein [Sphingobium terrigena]